MLDVLINPLATFIKGHLATICTGITTVLLVVLGPYINRAVSSLTSSLHWIIRYIIFIVVCTVGFGFLSHIINLTLLHWLKYQHKGALVAMVISAYLTLAFFLKKQGHI